VTDYHGLYKAKLAGLHRARPMRADERIWSTKDIALVDGDIFKQAVGIPKNSAKRAALTPTIGRMTGT